MVSISVKHGEADALIDNCKGKAGTLMTLKFKPRDYVIVSAPDIFKGNKLGIVIKLCPDHDGAYRVQLFNPDNPNKDVCVNPLKGDLIISAEKS
jgi:hypothetical protein